MEATITSQPGTAGGVYLEVVEGPEAGRQIPVAGKVVIGRGEGVDVALADPNVSRRHCELTPGDGALDVRDLGSSNGTFVNTQEVVGTEPLAPGDELLVGVTVLELHGPGTDRQSAVRAIPAALRVPERTPDYAPPPLAPEASNDATAALESYLDVRVRRSAQRAPLILFALAVLFVVVFELTNGLGDIPDFKIVW